MFSQVGEALDILAAMEGQYEVKGNIIRFRNPASGSRFVMVRTWVEQRMGNWATTPESARPFTVTAILQALGEGLPAVE
jgi:gentisate 1,2-dioxygenase